MDIRAALCAQYHASLQMLRGAVDACPEPLWTAAVQPPFWRIVYHTLFYTHLYLMPNFEAFTPWEQHRDDLADLDPGEGEPVAYSKAELRDYLAFCERLVDEQVATLDLAAPTCGFWWYDPMPKLDHQLNNIRHVQHHTAVLSDRLHAAAGQGVEWIGRPA